MYFNQADDYLESAREYNRAFRLGKQNVTTETLEPAIATLRHEANAAEARAAVARERKGREVQREQRAHNKPLVLRWLRGELGGDLPRNIHTNRPLVRVKGDVVETSWGASVPLRVALHVFRLASKVRKSGVAWEATSMKQIQVGDFALTRIGPTGNIVIGCHDIPYRFAKLAADIAITT
jgi:hypothetical protein